MKKRVLNKNGFTLLEIITSLVLVGIVATVVSVTSSYLVNSFIFSRKNTDTLLKGQIAIARIQKELNNVKTVYVSGTNGSRIKFSSYKDTGTVEVVHEIYREGNNVLIKDGANSFVLTDDVKGISDFSLTYYDNYNGAPSSTFSANTRIIEISLVLTGAENKPAVFNARVAPSFKIIVGT